MKATLRLTLTGALTFGVATLGVAHAQMPGQASTPSASQTLVSPTIHPNPPAPLQQPTPLFRIGNLPVGVWAPVEPPYDAHANRNNAANPLWYEASNTD